MKHRRTPFTELNLLDDYLTFALASNPIYSKPCYKRILSVLLEREIGDVEILAQHAIPGTTSDYRGIRLDVEIKEYEDGEITNVYDLEPQKRRDIDFPRHNRFYAAKIDSLYAKAGEQDLSHMPELYIITITNFDIFGMDSRIYTIDHICKEYPDEVPYDNGLHYIYFNTSGKHGCCQSIQNMLNYMQNSDESHVVDDATSEIHNYISEIKKDPRQEAEYMTFGDKIDYEKNLAKQEGQFELINAFIQRYKDSKSMDAIKQDLETMFPDYMELISKVINN